MARLTDSFGGSAGGAFFGPGKRGKATPYGPTYSEAYPPEDRSVLGLIKKGAQALTGAATQAYDTYKAMPSPLSVLPAAGAVVMGHLTGGTLNTPSSEGTAKVLKGVMGTGGGTPGVAPAGGVGTPATGPVPVGTETGSAPLNTGTRGGTPTGGGNPAIENRGPGTGGYAGQGDGGRGVINQGTNDAIATIDGSIGELRNIISQSLVDPEMTAIVNSFMANLNASLAQIQSDLEAWYGRMGGQQDLGLQNAIKVLQDEINTQKGQLEESLNARGMLQSGVMAAAEAKLRGGGLDRIQQLVANRLSELTGIIMQSVTSLAQSRMASMTQMANAGLNTIGGMAQAREQTRGAAMGQMTDLYSQKAQAQQQGAVAQVSAAQNQQQMDQQAWYNQQQAANSAEQNRITNDYYQGMLKNQSAQNQPTAAMGISYMDTAMSKIDSGQYSEAEFQSNYDFLAQYDPTMAEQFKLRIQNYLQRTNQSLVRNAPAGQTATGQFGQTATGAFGGYNQQ